MLSELDPQALMLWLEGRSLRGVDLDAVLREIECPTLLLQGDPQRGAALFDEDAERALALLRRGSRVQIPEASHMLHHSHPEAVASALNGFCDQGMS
jgi:pimeloyl-ACP methyl ester carboxylesterase